MKHIYILVVTLFVYFSSYAQDPQLFENTWVLQSVAIDDLIYESPYIESEPVTGTINFYEEASYIDIIYCDILSPAIEYDSNENTFTLEDNPVILLGDCIHPDNNWFAFIYFSVFYNQTIVQNPFTYSIINVNGIAILSIVNSAGIGASYINEILSTPNINDEYFAIYPNPATHKITIENTNQDSINKILVYDTLGRLVLEENNPSNQLDISKLDSGLLFLTIETDKGVFTKKIIKQ